MRIFIAGDSTAADYPSGQAPQAGWGQALARFLDVPVVNGAYPGASARSSIERLGMHDRIMSEIGAGDVLLICFGHNDPRHDQQRFGAPYGAYTSCLRRYVDGARSRDARPVLVTPVERRTPDGSSTHGEYPAAMRALAEAERVPLVDLQSASARRWRELGPDATRELFLWLGPHPNYPRGSADDTHFTAAGAIEVARLLLAEAGPLLPPAARIPDDLTWRTPVPVPSIDARTGGRRAEYATATPQEVGAVCRRAADLLPVLDEAGPRGRAALLDAMAAALDDRTDELVAAADAETALGGARLTGEAARTSGQLRLFAEVLREGSFLDVRIDSADPAAVPPKPDLRRMNVPLGVAGVFSASNFPFAFSVAGGDTASALAAGCTVVVKAHELHPETSVRTLGALRAGAAAAGLPEDVVQLVHGRDAGTALVQDGRVKAIGFTGSVRGGRYLHDLAMARPEPIPFYGELGSLNPLVVTPGAAKARLAEIAEGLAASVALGAGQFCVKPGLVLAPAGSGLADAMAGSFTGLAPQTLLGDGIRSAFTEGAAERASIPGLRTVATGRTGDGRQVAARLMAGPVSLLGSSELLLEECFGPMTVVLEYSGEADLADALAAAPGSLTVTLHSEPHEAGLAARLAAIARDRAGRLVFDGYPTGVTVGWAQQHGGPYPATTAPTTTSVGTAAIARFLRPVAYQDCPPPLLPPALRDDNPWRVPRRVDGTLVLPEAPPGGAC
ncbi:aldehyde dehydrogenase family protein [Actinomadura montaniterrae]|uniref:Aldehyde dehydrogenase family protein n=1 Tax=Actinomadura montaniterrae TaxID=1803903 RepID=A0A6L3W184_9ACTN|nr:aldehyde dehydrogenase family protein [Actinomadura montaniterrae]KAB2388643.1 aldehyde dehydrogenase family protein [Actinomadura montaniterrae]